MALRSSVVLMDDSAKLGQAHYAKRGPDYSGKSAGAILLTDRKFAQANNRLSLKPFAD